MKNALLLALLTTALLLAFAYRITRREAAATPPAPVAAAPASGPDMQRLVELDLARDADTAATLRSLAEKLRQRLQRPDARAQEAVLTFKNAEALRAFLARAAGSGLEVLASIESLNTVRVRCGSADALARELLGHSADYEQVAANYLITPPPLPPEAQARAAGSQTPLGNNLLAFLGVTGDPRNLGRGVTLAVLDSGTAPDATFGTGRLRTLDIGFGTAPSGGNDSGHGTAVAALVGGMNPDAQGVAPASHLLAIRVTDNEGKSDTFALAQGILAAADAGAKIINISLGGYGTNAALNQAIDRALESGAVIVASAGNDQAGRLTWPAADPRVISVGAVDADGRQARFSNSGPQLQLAAPGLGVQTAWTGNTRVLFDGTSASAPIVSGAIAAVLSQDPALTPAAAWQIVQKYSSEAGAPGTDPDYGHGIVNLGWALARNDPTRADTAMASHYYDTANEQLLLVAQNRGAQAVAGLALDITLNGSPRRQPVAWLAPGETAVVAIPLSLTQLKAAGRIELRTELVNPANLSDSVPENNRRASTLASP